ncbi:MAG: aminoglycoside phosphotransferase family protein [Acidobacteriota bacterium]|nr:aminoglycoside phosphotransferase family protein [Acidobacteriota bacterium]
MTLAEIKKTISRCCPDWTIDSARYLDEGDFFVAYVVNDDWIFRFAKHEAAKKSLERENCLLPKLAGQITLRIPAPQIARLEDDAKSSFVAYPFLPGEALLAERYFALDDANRTVCANQAARFLNELHAADVRLAENCGVLANDYTAQYSTLLKRARENLFSVLNEPERLFIERVIENYLASGAASDFRPALLHGDLSPDHFIFDERRERISAVIDFGDTMIGDAAWDFLWIYEHYGLDFLARMLPTYDESDKTALLRRVFQFSLLETIEWTVGCQAQGGEDFADALIQLQTSRIQEKTRLAELLGVSGNF